jgi:hypothetical protein
MNISNMAWKVFIYTYVYIYTHIHQRNLAREYLGYCVLRQHNIWLEK